MEISDKVHAHEWRILEDVAYIEKGYIGMFYCVHCLLIVRYAQNEVKSL